MKCDELEAEQWLDYSGEPMPCYPKAKADAAIAELKQKLEDAKATAYTESVDAGMRERRLRRALWLARAERAKEMAKGYNAVVEWCSHSRWIEVERKCLKKAKEYR